MRKGRLQRSASSNIPSSSLSASGWFESEMHDDKANVKRGGKRFSVAPRFVSFLDPRDAFEPRNDIDVEAPSESARDFTARYPLNDGDVATSPGILNKSVNALVAPGLLPSKESIPPPPPSPLYFSPASIPPPLHQPSPSPLSPPPSPPPKSGARTFLAL